MKTKIHYLTRLLLLFCFAVSFSGYAQSTIAGIVIDENSEPVAGANVVVKGTTNGVVTNFDGEYTIEVPNESAVLVFSFIGLKSQEIAVGSRTTINVTMIMDATQLDDVFVSATSKPIRRIESTTATESISAKEIERQSPTGIADLVRYVPGVFVQNKSGRTRNFIFIRGFPDGGSNGLIYTSLMVDGIKTFGSSEVPPDAGFRNDLNVERVEVVKGSAGTLYGRGAASGAINVISKTGAEKFNGIIKTTVGNNNWYQLDFNVNGPLSKDKSWRYNAGGFLLSDDGYRDAPFGDNGGQFRFNLDKKLSNGGNIRLYAGVIAMNVNNYLDIPYAINDLSKPVGDWDTRNTVLQAGNPFEGGSWPFDYSASGGGIASNEYDEFYKKGNFSEGFNIGANIDLNLGGGLKLSNKLRFQSILNGVTFDFPINNVGGAGNSAVATYGDTQTRVIVAGGRTNGGSDTRDLINETRFTKTFEGANSSHAISFGGYASLFNIKSSADAAIFNVDTSSPQTARETITGVGNGNPNEFFALSFRNIEADENTFSVFAGDEMKFGEKFSLSVGARYDVIKLDLLNLTPEVLVRDIDYDGFSGSIGFNYLFNPETAVYGNFSSTYRAPDFGTHTPFARGPAPGTFTKPRIDKNENITSVEVGFRKSTGDFSFDGGVFITDIANRRIGGFVNAVAVQLPAGDNHIQGLEVSAIYTPRSFSGFYARTSITAQRTKITDFTQTITYINPADTDATITETIDFEGNELTDVPPFLWNVSIGYTKEKYGININNSYIAARWADPYNTVKYPSRSLVTANAYVQLAKGFQINVGATNLLNNQKISSAVNVRNAAAPTLYVAEKFGNTGQYSNIFGIPLLPRRIFASLQYKF